MKKIKILELFCTKLANLVADQTANGTVQFRCNSSSQHFGGHSPRLSDNDIVSLAKVLTVHRQVLRNLRRLSRASESLDYDNPISANNFEKLLLVVQNAKLCPGTFLADDKIIAYV